jgi:hypothetical protein
MKGTLAVAVATAVAAACHAAPGRRAVGVAADRWTAACETPALPAFRNTSGALTAAERDSILRDVAARRAAWRARHITDYQLRVGETCFCPGSPPGVVEVRNGIAVAVRDTAGRSARPLLARWSSYTVEGLFDVIERTARSGEVLEVRYDACLGYPTAIRGNMKQVDTWFQIAAGPLTQPR